MVEETLLVCGWEVVRVVGAAVNVGAGVQGGGDGFFTRGGVVVGHEDVLHGVAIGGHPLLLGGPVPVVTEDCLEEPGVGAGGHAVECAERC